MSKKKNKKQSQLSMVMKRLMKNKAAVAGMIIIILLVLVAIFAEFIIPYDYAKQDYTALMQKPSLEHPFGTDNLGRDVLSRILYATRISLSIGFFSVLLAAFIGGTVGSIAGYYGGMLDNLLMRFLDIYQSIPAMVLCLAMATVLGQGVVMTIIAIGVATMGGYARMMRSSVMQVKESEFIEAARAVNGGDLRILLKHAIPNAIAPMIVSMSMGVGAAIITVSMLGFVGMGIPAPTPEWGAMLAEGRAFMRDSQYLVLAPGFSIVVTVMAFNLFGDGLRDALDPKLKD